MSSERLWTPSFTGMGLTNFLFFMSHYILIAALPVFLVDNLHGSSMDAGLAMTCFQIGTVGFRPLAGKIIDSFNKKKLLIVIDALFLLIMLAFNFAGNVTSVFGLRFIHGIAFAIGTTTSATLAALVLPQSLKRTGIGYFAVSGNLAMVVGPFVGLIIVNHLGTSMLFAFLTIIAIITFLIAVSVKIPPAVAAPSANRVKGFHISSFFEKKALPAVILGGFTFFAYGGVLIYSPMYARFLNIPDATSFFFLFFALTIVLSRPFINYLMERHNVSTILYPGFFLFAAGFLMMSQVTNTMWFIISSIVLGLGFGILAPSFQTLAVTSVPADRAGVATSTYFWSLDISVGLAATVQGVIIEKTGFLFDYGIICTASVILGAMYYFFYKKK